MRARARQLGGTLTIESAPGEGTVLSAPSPWSAPRWRPRGPIDAHLPSASWSATTTPSYGPGCSPCSAARGHRGRRRGRHRRGGGRAGREAHAPDVVLMDLQLGEGIDGVETTRRSPPPRHPAHVLVLTTYDTDADITRAIEAGATGYLLKAERPEELFSAIHAAARRAVPRSPLRSPAASWPSCAARAPPSPTANATSSASSPGHRQPGHRPRPVHQRGHGEDPPGPDLRQARRRHARGRGGGREGTATAALTGPRSERPPSATPLRALSPHTTWAACAPPPTESPAVGCTRAVSQDFVADLSPSGH